MSWVWQTASNGEASVQESNPSLQLLLGLLSLKQVVPIRVSSMDHINVYKLFVFDRTTYKTNPLKKLHTKLKYEHYSLTSRHKITLDRLTCCKNQSSNLFLKINSHYFVTDIIDAVDHFLNNQDAKKEKIKL